MIRSIGKQFWESAQSVAKKKMKAMVEKILQKRKVFSLEWKSEGMMDESGEPMKPMGEVGEAPLVEFGKWELGCRIST